MKIILDTNVIQEDFLMRSGRFQVLFDFVRKTGANLVLTQLVHDELAANYRRALQERLAKWVRAKEQVNGMLANPAVAHLDIQADAATNEYMTLVRAALDVSVGDIAPHGDHLSDVLKRAIERRRPCSDRGEEIRDAVLWHSVLDIAKETGDRVAFVSKNTEQFSADKTSLHPSLFEEAFQEGARVEYYPSLEDFARRHATPIGFITLEWINKHINQSAVLESARDFVESSADSRIKQALRNEEDLTGYFRMAEGDLTAREFFVYEMEDGSHRIEITWFGIVDVEYEFEFMHEEMAWEYDYDINPATGDMDYQPGVRRTRERRTRIKTIDLELSIVIEAFVRDAAVTRFNVIEGWLG